MRIALPVVDRLEGRADGSPARLAGRVNGGACLVRPLWSGLGKKRDDGRGRLGGGLGPGGGLGLAVSKRAGKPPPRARHQRAEVETERHFDSAALPLAGEALAIGLSAPK